jgi:hypothetical protein
MRWDFFNREGSEVREEKFGKAGSLNRRIVTQGSDVIRDSEIAAAQSVT